jgi:hypothetical protein
VFGYLRGGVAGDVDDGAGAEGEELLQELLITALPAAATPHPIRQGAPRHQHALNQPNLGGSIITTVSDGVKCPISAKMSAAVPATNSQLVMLLSSAFRRALSTEFSLISIP